MTNYEKERNRMVDEQIALRDVRDPRVLAAMRKVPRHLFVPPETREAAYQDSPLPIGLDQTISQPYIVALMTQLAKAAPGKKVLDVGTGSGYQAAVLAETCEHVYSIEILCQLATEADLRLKQLGYKNVTVKCGDGYAGWPEAAPFDLIIVAAAPRDVPAPLIDQLAPGGRLVIPVGSVHQELLVVEKAQDGSVRRFSAGGVRFVPMTGQAQKE
jgi:protein-L-isoaspartate(D-aspartate) O-methyltransferase